MKLRPVITEKSLNDAKSGKYSFWVERGATKPQIKDLIQKVLNVKVDTVRTLNYKTTSKKGITGKQKTNKAIKKAIVTLKGKDKLEMFGESKK